MKQENITQLLPNQPIIEKFKTKLQILLSKKHRKEWQDTSDELIELVNDSEFPSELFQAASSLLQRLDRLDLKNRHRLPIIVVIHIKYLIYAINLFLEPATADNFISLAKMGMDMEYSVRYDENTLIEVVNTLKSNKLSWHVRIWMGLAMVSTTSKVRLLAIENCPLDGENGLNFYKTIYFHSLEDDDVICAAIDRIIDLQDNSYILGINCVYLELLEGLPFHSKGYARIVKRVRFYSPSAYFSFFKNLIQNKCTSDLTKQAIKERLETDEKNMINKGNNPNGESDEMNVAIRRLSFLLMNYM